MTYVLHYAPDNASMIIRIALEMMDVPYEAKLVDRAARAQESTSYRNVNPQGMIPALETPEGTLFETAAILLWLTERHDALAPTKGDPLRGRFLSWLFALSNTMHPALRQSFYPEKFISEPHAEALRAGLREEIARFLAIAEAECRKAEVLGAPNICALDIYLGAMLRWARIYPSSGPCLASMRPYPTLQAMLERLDAEPSVLRIAEAEGLGASPFATPSLPNPPIGSAM